MDKSPVSDGQVSNAPSSGERSSFEGTSEIQRLVISRAIEEFVSWAITDARCIGTSGRLPFLASKWSADSSGKRDKLRESLGWSIPAEGLAGPFVEQRGDVVEVVLVVEREVGALREELTHEAVPVLVGAALPG